MVFDVILPADPALAIDGDPQILSAIVVNLVQNAIKFTAAMGHVVVGADATAERVRIYVSDQCGGLPAGVVTSMTTPFQQHSRDRSGLGLGLFIARRGAAAHDGDIDVQDLPGTGCVFSLHVPRAARRTQ